MLNVLVIVGYLVLSVGWFFLGHLIGFVVLGRIVGDRSLAKAAKIAGMLTGAWVLVASIVAGISLGFERTIGFAEVFVAGVLAPLAYLCGLAFLSHRFYALSRAYSMLAALAIGFSYLIATVILSIIVQFVFVVGFMTYLSVI
ncbi:MAG: hypothetical protein ACMXYM_03200 [Candidatus Woesearchaeota archaeon]